MIEHVVFLLEEPSAQDFLEGLLDGRIQNGIETHYIVFEGKQDLEKNLDRRLKGWVRPNTKFIVMRDQDRGDGPKIKQKLLDLCIKAGKPQATIRIACRELEAFFLGDWQAIADAFEKPSLAAHDRKAKYRQPDDVDKPSNELIRLIAGYQKRDGARRISRRLVPERNRSRSFQLLFRTLEGIGS